jgi:uncharacterized protein YhdP
MRRLAAGLLGLADFLLTGVAVLLGLAGWRLVTGPIEADFLTPHLERQLSADSLRVDIGSSRVRWDGLGRPIRLVATDTLVDRPGGPSAVLPSVALALDPAALLQGRIAPSEIALEGPTLHLVRTEAGAFEWALETSGAGAPAPRPAAAGVPPPLDPNDPESWPEPLRRLERFRVADASVIFEDRRTDHVWHGRNASLAVRRGPAGLLARFAAEIGEDGAQGRVAAAAVRRADGGGTEIAFRVAGLPSDLLAEADAALAPLAALRTRLDGTGRIALGPGWRPQTGTLDLAAEAGSLMLPGLYDRPITMARLALAAEADFRDDSLVVDRAQIDLGGPRILAAGDMRYRDGALRSLLTATLFDLPVDLLPRYWPPGLNREARAWVAEHIADGRVDHATLELEAESPADRPAALEPRALRARFGYSGLTVRYLDGLPPVAGVGGTGSYDGEAVRFAVEEGEVVGLPLESGAIAITDFEVPGEEIIDIDLAVAGPLAPALSLLDEPRLGYASALGLDPAAAGGAMAARLRFVFPLSADLALDEVAIGVAANLRGASLGEVAEGVTLSGVDGALALTGDGLEVDASGRFNGIPASFVWRERFRQEGRPLTEVDLSGTLDRAALTALGLGDARLSGPVPFRARYRDRDRSAQSVSIALDLAEAAVTLPDLAYAKPAGEPAEATLEIALRERRVREIAGFSLSGPETDVRGTAILGEDGASLQSLRFDRFRLGETRFAGSVARTESGGFAVDVAGDRFDARRWLTAERLSGADDPAAEGDDDAPPGPAPPPWQVDARFEEVILGEGTRLHEAAFAFAQASDGAESAVLTARTGNGGDIRLEYSSDGGDAASASVRTDDANAVLRAFGLGSRVRGGELFFHGAMTGTGTAGRLRVDDFRAVEAPLLARLLGAMSLPGLVDLLSGDGLAFDRLSADLALAGDSLTIENGRAAGGSLGLSLSGRVGLGDGALDLSGTAVPAYGVNSAIGAIPLVGDLLTGGEGGGIIAFTYRAGGTLDDPQVRVNPLSALAPGLLRRIFFAREGLDIAPARPPGESRSFRGNGNDP